MTEVVPFFSVVIPTYNRAFFIAATIRSVLSQEFANIEVLVVDDGSTDNTAEVIKTFILDKRLHYLPKQNAERGAARNYGLTRARGEYVVFLDSDDLWQSNHLAVLHQAILNQRKPNFIACKFVLERNGHQTPSDLASLPAGHYSRVLLLHGNPFACNFALRLANPNLILFEEDRQYAAVEDWMFLLQNMQQDTIYLVDAVTVIMNDHDNRSMRDNYHTMINRWLKLPLWLDSHIKLMPSERQQLIGHIHYLCAIHTYAGGARNESLGYAWRAAPGLSVTKATILILRCLAGIGAVEIVKKALAK